MTTSNRKPRTSLSEAERQEVVALYKDDTPIVEIMHAYDIAETTFYRILRERRESHDITFDRRLVNRRPNMPKKKGTQVEPSEARQIIDLFNSGMIKSNIARKLNRSDMTIGTVIRNQDQYLIPPQERARKGIAIPHSFRDKDKESLRLPAKAPAEAPRFDPQVSDTQVSFPFAIALLEKATEIVRALSRQQHPPELMQLVKDTIEAAVQLEIANRVADTVADSLPEPAVPEPVSNGASPVPTFTERLLIANR